MEIRADKTIEGSLAIYAKRRDRLRDALDRANLDCLLVSAAANRFYLSGFELHDGQPGETSGYLIISRSGEDWLATDSRYAEAAKKLWPENRILVYGRDQAKSLCGLLARLGGLAGYDPRNLGAAFCQRLGAAKAPGLAFVAAPPLVEKLREIKEPLEIAALKNSFRLNHALFGWLETRVENGELAGLPEKGLAWEIEKYFRENGAQELAFSTIAAYGKNGGMPHAIPGAFALAPETPILVDAGCRVDDYCSDQTRVFWHGKNPSREYLDALRLVKRAQEAALAIIRPGVACADVYKAAYKVFEDAGVAKDFTHGLGHGVGLETHELPSLSPASKEILAEGMTVTVEPGLYQAWGGVRWEYTVVVEADGCQVL